MVGDMVDSTQFQAYNYVLKRNYIKLENKYLLRIKKCKLHELSANIYVFI